MSKEFKAAVSFLSCWVFFSGYFSRRLPVSTESRVTNGRRKGRR